MANVVAVDIVEALMGHQGYLTEAYRRYTIDQLAEFYQKGEATLSVFTEMEEVSKLRKDVEETKEALQSLVNGLTRENMELKRKLETLESQIGTLVVENKGYAEDVAHLKKEYKLLWDTLKQLAQLKEDE